MTIGCNRDICVNVYCKNNPNFLLSGKGQSEIDNQIKELINLIRSDRLKIDTVCCHSDYMNNIKQTLQLHNIELSKNIEFINDFIQSPYALSLSFLKDP
jgi:hypothetical protein